MKNLIVFLAMVSFLVMSGCHTKGAWNHMGVSQEQWTKDYDECHRGPHGGSPSLGGFIREISGPIKFENCMKAKGYTRYGEEKSDSVKDSSDSSKELAEEQKKTKEEKEGTTQQGGSTGWGGK
jgi:hypothetical protein